MDPTSKSQDIQLADALHENETLRRELVEARRLLEQSEVAVRAATDELQQFVYAASHDLQQPLRTISSYAQLLQRDQPKDTPAAEFASFIIDAAKEMNQLVRDLLTYSRTGNSVRRSNINLNSPVQWALMKLAARIKDANAEIVVGADLPEVYADEAQLAQVFEHVITNSIQYCGTETPRIEILAEETPDGIIVSIKDNGPGIEPRFHEQVFVPFKRLHGKNIPGSGLGLSLSRKIIRAHEGKIWTESDGVQGTTVKFSIPA